MANKLHKEDVSFFYNDANQKDILVSGICFTDGDNYIFTLQENNKGEIYKIDLCRRLGEQNMRDEIISEIKNKKAGIRSSNPSILPAIPLFLLAYLIFVIVRFIMK